MEIWRERWTKIERYGWMDETLREKQRKRQGERRGETDIDRER